MRDECICIRPRVQHVHRQAWPHVFGRRCRRFYAHLPLLLHSMLSRHHIFNSLAWILEQQDIADLAGLSDATALTHVFFQTNAGGAPATDKALDANPVCSNGEYEAAVR